MLAELRLSRGIEIDKSKLYTYILRDRKARIVSLSEVHVPVSVTMRIELNQNLY